MKNEKEILLAAATPAEWWAWAEQGGPCLRCDAMHEGKPDGMFSCNFCESFSGWDGLGCYDGDKYKTDSEAAIASLIRAGIEKPKEPL